MSTFIGMGVNNSKTPLNDNNVVIGLQGEVSELEKQVEELKEQINVEKTLKEEALNKVSELEKQVEELKKSSEKDKK